MKNTIRFLEAMRIIAIIAMVAMIGFTFTACGGNDDDDNTPTAKTYTLSLDKVNSNTFTITLEGGVYLDSVSYIGNTLVCEPQPSYTGILRTSDTVVTFQMTTENYTGTISFSDNLLFARNVIAGFNFDIDNIVANPLKNSITFQ